MNHVLLLSSINYLLALTEPCDYWLSDRSLVLDHAVLDRDVGSDHGTDTTSERFKHLRGIPQSLISEFLQWKFSILSPAIQSHTINSSCKTNFVDKCSHNLSVSDITWRLSSLFILFLFTRVSADIIRGLVFWQLCFSTYFSLKYTPDGILDYSYIHTCIWVKTIYSYLHSTQWIY